MRIIATFDGSAFAEASLPLLARVAALPDAEITLLGVVDEPAGRRKRGSTRRPVAVIASGDPVYVDAPKPQYIERRDQAIDARMAEMEDYLRSLIARLPGTASYAVEVHMDNAAAQTIIETAKQKQADVIVMATHGRTGIVRSMFGSVTEDVLRSHVAPMLLVHPDEAPQSPATTDGERT